MKNITLRDIIWALLPSGNMPPRSAESNGRTKKSKEKKRRQLTRLRELDQQQGKTMKDYMVKLGRKVKDVVTGFEGVCDSISFDLYGCVLCIVSPSSKGIADPDKARGRILDWKRLEVIDTNPVMPVPDFALIVPGQENGPASRP